MNSRERFLAVLQGQPPDRPPLFPEGMREEVIEAWQRQGLVDEAALGELFHYDPFEQLDPDVYPRPEIGDWSNPRELLPMLRRRLEADDPARLPEGWEQLAGRPGNPPHGREYPIFMRIHPGLLLSLGVEEWRSFAPAIYRLTDEPEVARQILAIQADFAARLAEKVLRRVDVDGVVFSEPIAGNSGALISPGMYRELALESYAPVFEVLQSYNVPAIIWRSYANPARLIPEVVKYPFNALWLCETPRGALKPEQVWELAGRRITLIGGIDTDVLYRGEAAMRREVAEAVAGAAGGGLIPLADGRVREDVPYANYVFYRQELELAFLG